MFEHSPATILVIASKAGLSAKKIGPHEYAVRCPRFPLHKNNDLHPSCRLNDEKGTFYCDVCGCGGGIKEFARLLGVNISDHPGSGRSAPGATFSNRRGGVTKKPLHFESNGPISVATQNRIKQLLGKVYSPEAWAMAGVLEGKVKDFPAIAFPLPSGGYKACLYTRPDLKREKRYSFRYTDGGKPDLLIVGEGTEVLLTAGEWDLMAALTTGFPCVATGTGGEMLWKDEWSQD